MMHRQGVIYISDRKIHITTVLQAVLVSRLGQHTHHGNVPTRRLQRTTFGLSVNEALHLHCRNGAISIWYPH